jgi:hypothetical protein
MPIERSFFVAAFACCLVMLLLADSKPTYADPALPGELCGIPARDIWTEPESWAWQRICVGETADFNARTGVALEPRNLEGWSGDRTLSSEFLETILLYEPYRSSLTRKGVRIIGAWFPEPIDLENARIHAELWLDDSRFEKGVSLGGVRDDGLLSLEGSSFASDLNMYSAVFADSVNIIGCKFAGTVDMESIQVAQSLLMREKAEFRDVDLWEAKIGGDIDMRGSKFAGTVNMDSVEVGQSLSMSEKAEFHDVILLGAKIGGQIDMRGSKFVGKLDMDSAEVGQLLLMREKAEFQDVLLLGAKIGGQIDMSGSKFVGKVDMDWIEVGESVLAQDSVFDENGEWSLVYAKITSGLDLSGGGLKFLNLTGTRIGGELGLGTATGHGAPHWRKGSRMALRNTYVGAIQDRKDSWPDTLELEGFTYGWLGGLGAEGKADIEKRSSAWLIDWLARDPTYSPQPYEQLAAVLTKGGQAEKADEVLYAGRERERLELQKRLLAGQGSPQAWLDFFWKCLLHASIGYGYKIHRAFYGIAFFVVVGTVWIWRSRQLTRHRIATGAAGTTPLEYSIDMLLPIIELRKQHYEIDLTGPVRYYFYIHKLAGFVLVSFLIAGLAGLTK